MVIEPNLLAVEPHSDRVGIIDIDTMHLTPGICGRLEFRVITAHLTHLIPEIRQEDRLDMFLNQFLSMTGDEIKAGRILLFGIRDTDGGQTFGSRLRGSTFMTSLEYTDNSGIRNRMIIKTDRIPEAMDEVLSDKRFQFEIYHEIAHIHWFWVQR